MKYSTIIEKGITYSSSELIGSIKAISTRSTLYQSLSHDGVWLGVLIMMFCVSEDICDPL